MYIVFLSLILVVQFFHSQPLFNSVSGDTVKDPKAYADINQIRYISHAKQQQRRNSETVVRSQINQLSLTLTLEDLTISINSLQRKVGSHQASKQASIKQFSQT